MMGRSVVAALALLAYFAALWGCVPPTGPGSFEYDVTHAIYDPLQKFALESPTNCQSPDLQQSSDTAFRVAYAFTDYRYINWAGGQLIYIANTAKRKGCLDAADSLYRQIVSTFSGGGYAAIREQARIGIDDIRELRRNVSTK